jgi:GNAT superfamily N-acetyltransferase
MSVIPFPKKQSLYARYIKERENIECLETEDGFCTYAISPDGNELHIHDVYVVPEKRKTGIGSEMVRSLEKEFRGQYLITFLDQRTKGWQTSQKAQEAYGFKFFRVLPDGRACFMKEIQHG